LTILYDIAIGNQGSSITKPTDETLISKLEVLIIIPTMLMANIIEQ
jgi:hypothetical protein